jgi:hypothetical protein
MTQAEVPPDIPLFDSDGAISREFLLQRGYCCRCGCRNCPYGFHDLENAPDTDSTGTDEADRITPTGGD